MNIAIIYSLPTRRARQSEYVATDEDTAVSAKEIEVAIVEKGHEVTAIPIDEDSIDRIDQVQADLIVNLIEWDGHDLPLTDQAMERLEKLGIPYTGSTREVLLLANDKRSMKERLDSAKLPTPRWQLFTLGNESLRPDLAYPAIVKLSLEHCSVGLNPYAVVHSEHELRSQVRRQVVQFDESVIVEEYISGREIQATLLEPKSGLVMLPPAEIIFHEAAVGMPKFLTFESRWLENHPEYDASTLQVAKLDDQQLKNLELLSKRTWSAFGFRHYCRLDLRMRDNEFYILEANANPGLGDDEDYGMTISYKAAGMTFSDFVWEIVQSSLYGYSNA